MEVPPDAVRAQLDRVLGSDPFAGAGRLSRLLRYLVERTLAGEGDQLKEYALGVDVFDRGDQYDPRLDSIVRVEARRLRARLAEYYAGPGARDPLVIDIPRGSYQPVFQAAGGRRADARRLGIMAGAALAAVLALLLSSTAWRSGPAAAPDVTVAVLPFEQYSASPEDARLAAHLTDAVTAELARIGTVGVVSRTSARQYERHRLPLREIARALNANVLMEATLTTDGPRVRVQARLVDGVLDRKMWVQDFEGARSDVPTFARRIAASAAEAALLRRPRS